MLWLHVYPIRSISKERTTPCSACVCVCAGCLLRKCDPHEWQVAFQPQQASESPFLIFISSVTIDLKPATSFCNAMQWAAAHPDHCSQNAWNSAGPRQNRFSNSPKRYNWRVDLLNIIVLGAIPFYHFKLKFGRFCSQLPGDLLTMSWEFPMGLRWTPRRQYFTGLLRYLRRLDGGGE